MRIVMTTTGELVPKKAENFVDSIPKIARGRIFGRMENARKRITKYPAPWNGSLPKGWFKSDRQRRFVMALVREGRVPYKRTGAYMDEWKLKAQPDGYALSADSDKARWVGGDDSGLQSKIHKGRWGVAVEIVKQEQEKLPDEILHLVHTTASNEGLS